MAGSEKNHFGKTVLDLSERAHQALGHSLVGKAVTRAITGSPYPGYRQLDYVSRDITHEVKATIKVPGDPTAGIVPRFWKNAAVMAGSRYELNRLLIGSDESPKEAIAYISEDVVHVGFDPEANLFNRVYDDEEYAAMRLGKGALEATMGIWIPKERHFISVDTIRLVSPSARVEGLTPDVTIV